MCGIGDVGDQSTTGYMRRWVYWAEVRPYRCRQGRPDKRPKARIRGALAQGVELISFRCVSSETLYDLYTGIYSDMDCNAKAPKEVPIRHKGRREEREIIDKSEPKKTGELKSTPNPAT